MMGENISMESFNLCFLLLIPINYLERFLSLDRDLDLRSLDRLSFDLSLLLLDLDLLSLDLDLLLSLDFDLRLKIFLIGLSKGLLYNCFFATIFPLFVF